MPRVNPDRIGGINVAAFLDALAVSEIGVPMLKASDDGYNVIVGSTPRKLVLMDGYSDHPGRSVYLPALKIHSTAAGRYQLLKRYYRAYKRILSLHDFSPESQDLIAARQIREQGAIIDLQKGRLFEAVAKCRNIWASLPGAGYGQHEHDYETIKAAYILNGGTIS